MKSRENISVKVLDSFSKLVDAELEITSGQVPCSILFKFEDLEFYAEASDLFECLQQLKQRLESSGILLCCAGVRSDVRPSGMSLQMSDGRMAYIISTRPPELVDIFSYIPPEVIVRLAEQETQGQSLRADEPVRRDTLEEEARKNPGGWVYVIDGEYAPHERVPPEAIRGAWQVRDDGKLSGKFVENPNFVPRDRR